MILPFSSTFTATTTAPPFGSPEESSFCGKLREILIVSGRVAISLRLNQSVATLLYSL
jgi:hypothetical protein